MPSFKNFTGQYVGDSLVLLDRLEKPVDHVYVNGIKYSKDETKKIKRTWLLDGSWIDEEVD